jgi:hypothetical protein
VYSYVKYGSFAELVMNVDADTTRLGKEIIVNLALNTIIALTVSGRSSSYLSRGISMLMIRFPNMCVKKKGSQDAAAEEFLELCLQLQ